MRINVHSIENGIENTGWSVERSAHQIIVQITNETRVSFSPNNSQILETKRAFDCTMQISFLVFFFQPRVHQFVPICLHRIERPHTIKRTTPSYKSQFVFFFFDIIVRSQNERPLAEFRLRTLKTKQCDSAQTQKQRDIPVRCAFHFLPIRSNDAWFEMP